MTDGMTDWRTDGLTDWQTWHVSRRVVFRFVSFAFFTITLAAQHLVETRGGGEEGEAVPRPAALAQWSLAFAFYLHDMWAHYNFNRLNLFAALQIKCWVLFYATPAAKFHVQLSFVRHRQGARAAWEGVVCSSPLVFAKRVSFSLNLCLNLWFGNVYVVSKGSFHVPRCGNIKWREGEGERGKNPAVLTSISSSYLPGRIAKKRHAKKLCRLQY